MINFSGFCSTAWGEQVQHFRASRAENAVIQYAYAPQWTPETEPEVSAYLLPLPSSSSPSQSAYRKSVTWLRHATVRWPSQAGPGQNRASQLSPQKFKVRWENRENTRWQRPLNVVKQYIHRLYASYIGLYTAYTTIYNIYISIDLLRLNKRFTFLWRRVESSWRCGVGNVERRWGARGDGEAEDWRQCKIS